jgi:hypothetical protein
MTVSFDLFGFVGCGASGYVHAEVEGHDAISTVGNHSLQQDFEYSATENAARNGFKDVRVHHPQQQQRGGHQCHIDPSDISTDDTESESKSSNSSQSPSCDDDSIQEENFSDLSFSDVEVTDLLLNLNEVLIPSPVECNEPDLKSCQIRSEQLSQEKDRSYMTLRVTYLLVTLVIMLADGLQGMAYPFYKSCCFDSFESVTRI